MKSKIHEFQKNKLIRMSKKLILTAVTTFILTASALAQTPMIKDFRAIIADRPNEFVNLHKALTDDNTAQGFKQYSSKIENLSFNKNIIINGNLGAQYIQVYNLLAMSTDIRQFYEAISKQYFDEIDAMVKTGQYTVEHYKANDGTLISAVKNITGEKILEYRLKPNEHMVLFVGPKK